MSCLEFNEIFFFSVKVIKKKKKINNAMSEPLFQLITHERLQNPRADAAIDWNICYSCQKDDTSGDLQFPCNKNDKRFIFKLFSVFVLSMNKEFSGIIYLNR